MGAIVTKRGSEECDDDLEHENVSCASDGNQVKMSFVGRLRTKILRGDSQIRTPVALERSCETPVKMMLVDPRSPGMMAGDNSVERTPLLSKTKKEDRQSGRLLERGFIPPAFRLLNPPRERLLQESGDPRSPAPETLGPRTPIDSHPPTKTEDFYPTNMVTERIKEDVTADMKETSDVPDNVLVTAKETV